MPRGDYEILSFSEVTQAQCGLEVDLDPEQIADGLLSILNDPKSAKTMGDRGREMVLSRYTWPAIASRMVGVYESAIARTGGRR